MPLLGKYTCTEGKLWVKKPPASLVVVPGFDPQGGIKAFNPEPNAYLT